MTSNTALSAGGGGGVGWQVDLPGLASLVLNLGASGLKRFAEAGVDFHTILCMGEIAEKCPASNEYRRELSVCRQAQRTESQWLYKLVEIGAATNFVADELLKKRAGENVVALMSAILPVMSESSCDNLLLKLFEACNTPLDKTPGFAQLRSIRKSLTPLARKTQFKDRAFQYHVLSRQLLGTDASPVKRTANESIPSEDTAVQVILALSKLVQEDSGHILAYHGLRGSGWVIAYARHVLGLPVCVLRSTSKPVPISGDYQSARVLAYLFEQENKCELLLNRNVQDFFVTKSLDPSCHTGWMIDVGTTNVLDSYMSAADPFRKGISVVARSMANSYIQKLAMCIITEDASFPGLIKYPVYCLPALRRRVARILSLLGFDSVDGSELTNGEWSEYIRLRKPTPKRSQSARRGLASSYLVAGPAWIKSGLGHTQVSGNGQRMKDSEDASAAQQESKLDEQGIGHASFLVKIVEIACLLSFTDWDQNLRLLSTSFLEDLASWRKCLIIEESLIKFLMRYEWREMRPLSMIDLCETTIDVCIGRREVWTPVFKNEEMLAFQYYGIVFVQNAAFHQKLDLQSCFLHLSPGAIVAEGEEKTELYTYSTHHQQLESISHRMTDLGRQMHKQFAPVDSFPGISFSTRLEFSGEKIYLQQNALVKDQIYAVPSPGIISRALAGLYVTKDCDHRYYDAMTVTNIHTSHDDDRWRIGNKEVAANLEEQVNYPFEPKQGLFLAGAECQWQVPKLWLQAVDQNAPGQWLAYQQLGNRVYPTLIDQNAPGQFLEYQHLGNRVYPTVLQRGCCTACACKLVRSYKVEYSVGVYRIIHGRLAGEDME